MIINGGGGGEVIGNEELERQSYEGSSRISCNITSSFPASDDA